MKRMNKAETWVIIILVSLAGSIGNILLKHATNSLGELSINNLFDIRWIITTFLNPIILGAFILIFTGRFATIIPTSQLAITPLVLSITIITLIFTNILEIIFLKARYSQTIWLGFLLGIATIYIFFKSV